MWTCRSFFSVAAMLASCLSLVKGDGDTVYRNQAISEVSWTGTVDVETLSQEEVYFFENAASKQFLSLLEQQEADDGVFSEATVLGVTVNVMNQEAEVSPDAPATLKSMVQVTYLAHTDIPSLAFVLEQASTDKDHDGIVQAVRVIDSDAKSFSVVFIDPADPSAQVVHVLDLNETPDNYRSAADKGLIVACTFLSIALVVVSGVLLWAAGGCLNLYMILKHGVPPPISQFSSDIKRTIASKFTSKDEYDEDTASRDMGDVGILGATSNEDQENQGVEVTPHRGVYRDSSDMASPMSQITNSTFRTDSSQQPLGIRSIRKLKRYMTPDKGKKKYDIKRMSYT